MYYFGETFAIFVTPSTSSSSLKLTSAYNSKIGLAISTFNFNQTFWFLRHLLFSSRISQPFLMAIVSQTICSTREVRRCTHRGVSDCGSTTWKVLFGRICGWNPAGIPSRHVAAAYEVSRSSSYGTAVCEFLGSRNLKAALILVRGNVTFRGASSHTSI